MRKLDGGQRGIKELDVFFFFFVRFSSAEIIYGSEVGDMGGCCHNPRGGP